ncbi:hypothetical protein BVRB_2g039070 [Beta vulgaris subsp. vulgaris]|nr:hypothetical protein BVRB_2g039070 [Beta vulgaris subsp. vulgaris]
MYTSTTTLQCCSKENTLSFHAAEKFESVGGGFSDF